MTALWAFAVVVFLVSIPALVISVLAYRETPENLCLRLHTQNISQNNPSRFWSYVADDGGVSPQNWGDMDKSCRGTRQSPINIKTSDVQTDNSYLLNISMFSVLLSSPGLGAKIVDFKDLVSVNNNGKVVSVSDVDAYLTYQVCCKCANL